MTDTATISALYRYPVKGMSPERLEAVEVEPGEMFPFDRTYAVEAGTKRFDPATPRHLPKVAFLMLMRDERLASLDTRFDESTHTLTIRRDGAVVCEGSLTDPIGRKVLEQFYAAFMADTVRGAPHIVSSPGHNFSDVAPKYVSIINLASVRDIGRVAEDEIDPLRFRGNIYVDGLDAWREFDWVDRTLALGDVRLRGTARISRCAAINVNPETATRDHNLPRLIERSFGHSDCGVYARVDSAGTLTPGLSLEVV